MGSPKINASIPIAVVSDISLFFVSPKTAAVGVGFSVVGEGAMVSVGLGFDVGVLVGKGLNTGRWVDVGRGTTGAE